MASSLLEGGSAASKACLQAPPPFPLPQYTARLGPLADFFFFHVPRFLPFPHCGAWTQATFPFISCFANKTDNSTNSPPLSPSHPVFSSSLYTSTLLYNDNFLYIGFNYSKVKCQRYLKEKRQGYFAER